MLSAKMGAVSEYLACSALSMPSREGIEVCTVAGHNLKDVPS